MAITKEKLPVLGIKANPNKALKTFVDINTLYIQIES